MFHRYSSYTFSPLYCFWFASCQANRWFDVCFSLFPFRSLKKTECGGFWFYLSSQSSTQGATRLSTTLHLHLTPTCLPSFHILPWCPHPPTCTQAWRGVWVTWVLSTSRSTIPLISTQSRVSWSRQCLVYVIILYCYLFILSTLFPLCSYTVMDWVKLFSLSVFQSWPVCLATALFIYVPHCNLRFYHF